MQPSVRSIFALAPFEVMLLSTLRTLTRLSQLYSRPLVSPFRFLHFTGLFLPTKKMITLEAMGRVFYDGPVNPHSPICRILTLTYLRFQYTVLSVIPVTAAFTIGQNHPQLTMLHSTHHNPHLIYD